MATSGGIKIISENRKAFHNYYVEDKFEAGIILKGTEVKSLREGKANLQDSYGLLKSGELFLLNAHIPPYKLGNRENHDPLRTRKLLLNRSELSKLWGKLETQGYSVIPLKMYFKDGLVKVEMALAKGKKSHDKREATKEKEIKRAMAKLTKQRR
ncbi:MAG: SsrA-binding protein SmpB [Deltaproteobacteria bacterium]|nr:SsrA-binding protein SmpB [Deltaproteobacteria bacterium]